MVKIPKKHCCPDCKHATVNDKCLVGAKINYMLGTTVPVRDRTSNVHGECPDFAKLDRPRPMPG
jgi:hypothetical protein